MMNQSVRAALIAVREDSILLVRHVHPTSGEEWWCPPGGALEDADASVQACVIREVLEETGMETVVGRLIYIREFRETDRNTRWVELYFLADSLQGSLTGEHLTGDRRGEEYIREAMWVARDKLRDLPVVPEVLRDQFWTDLAQGFPSVRHLGISSG